MATCTWTGGSGQKYDYRVLKLPRSFTPGKGNYIYTKLNAQGTHWVPVYIGEGELKDRSQPDNHHKGSCIVRNGATHIHWHTRHDTSQRARRDEEDDLLQNYSSPCND